MSKPDDLVTASRERGCAGRKRRSDCLGRAHARPSVSRQIAAPALTILTLLADGAVPAAAAALDGVSLPDNVTVGGEQLTLNGIGLRTYSILGIRIDVAGLYLRQRSSDPAFAGGQDARLPVPARRRRERCPPFLAVEIAGQLPSSLQLASTGGGTVPRGGAFGASRR